MTTVWYWLILVALFICAAIVAVFSYKFGEKNGHLQGYHERDTEFVSMQARIDTATELLAAATQKLEEVTRERDAARIQRDAARQATKEPQRPPLPPKRPLPAKKKEAQP